MIRLSENKSSRTGWMYRDKKPPNDDAVFEIMTRVVFQGGLSWELIERKWPNFQRAFANFEVEAVANFGDDKLADLIEDASIIRNSQKIESTIYNAKEFIAIREEHGSFLQSKGRLKPADILFLELKEFSKRFKRFGPKSCYIFLYGIDENIKREE